MKGRNGKETSCQVESRLWWSTPALLLRVPSADKRSLGRHSVTKAISVVKRASVANPVEGWAQAAS